jgi:hypothetical protein
MGCVLSTEELKKKFGAIYLQVISQNNNLRTSCVRKLSNNSVLAFSRVVFNETGIKAFKEFHNQILSGKPIGQAIIDSRVRHERIVSEKFRVKMYPGLCTLFNTKRPTCVGRKIDYKIKGLLYASINEFYNPNFVNLKNFR